MALKTQKKKTEIAEEQTLLLASRQVQHDNASQADSVRLSIAPS
jgi:hypothetical protein